MFRYDSGVTFIYYNDLEYGAEFIKKVLDLPLIMDQGFAKVYQINQTAFLGIVKNKDDIKYNGNTLVSLNTTDVLKEHNRVSKLEVFNITNIQHIPSIPLDSFFFKDKEGHDFEIQQFIKEEDISVFYSR
jgi:hypothetical protein